MRRVRRSRPGTNDPQRRAGPGALPLVRLITTSLENSVDGGLQAGFISTMAKSIAPATVAARRLSDIIRCRLGRPWDGAVVAQHASVTRMRARVGAFPVRLTPAPGPARPWAPV